jgi:signal peptidase I
MSYSLILMQDQPIEPVSPPEQPQKEGIASILSTVGVLLLAPLIAIVLTAFVFQSYQVNGPSMETTLQNNDRLIVWKMPRTWARITKRAYVPNRGDVVIFNEPQAAEDLGLGSGKQLIKRVIGLPGERVVVKDGTITVYNKQHPKGFKPDKTMGYNKDDIIPETSGNIDIVIPQGEMFVSGDNRPDSLDSRSFGPVPLNNIVGKLQVRILPLNNIKRF